MSHWHVRQWSEVHCHFASTSLQLLYIVQCCALTVCRYYGMVDMVDVAAHTQLGSLYLLSTLNVTHVIKSLGPLPLFMSYRPKIRGIWFYVRWSPLSTHKGHQDSKGRITTTTAFWLLSWWWLCVLCCLKQYEVATCSYWDLGSETNLINGSVL